VGLEGVSFREETARNRTISGSADETVGVWDLRRGKRLHVLEGHTDEVSAVVVTPEAAGHLGKPVPNAAHAAIA